jgi:DNA-binding transcriptional LysR family regulator
MELSQAHLQAFSEITRLGTFTKAAESLALTQSALSHRIRQLEEELGTGVFIRAGTKIRLTDTGRRLLQYCIVQKQAQEELIHDIKQDPRKSAKLAGRIRLGGVSSVMRSLVLPVLSEIIQKNPDVRLEFFVRETAELKELLVSGEVDFLITTEAVDVPRIKQTLLGYEENVLVQARSEEAVPDVYLDHDSNDMTTYAFFKYQSRKNQMLTRSFLDDVYGLLDAAVAGMGKAVLPLHLVSDHPNLKIVGGLKPLMMAVHLYHFDQPFYTKLHELLIESLTTNLRKQLRQK